MERRQCARGQFISVTVIAPLLFARTWHPAVPGSTWRSRGRVRRLLRPRITVSGLIGSADRGAVVARRHRAFDRLDLRGPSFRRRPNDHCAGRTTGSPRATAPGGPSPAMQWPQELQEGALARQGGSRSGSMRPATSTATRSMASVRYRTSRTPLQRAGVSNVARPKVRTMTAQGR